MNRYNVLDKGYVILHNTMGDDLTVVNAARVSYDKKKEVFDSKDDRLLHFLAREGHSSPYRHAALQFEIYAPLMVARQLWKYVVGSDHVMDAWNESSRRYITEEPFFYIPSESEWRSAPENSKQGSGAPIAQDSGRYLTNELIDYIAHGESLYEEAMKLGACAEQARLFLPAYGLYVRWYWTCSLQSALHFLDQRLSHDAQKEIQLYARAVEAFVMETFPRAHAAWTHKQD